MVVAAAVVVVPRVQVGRHEQAAEGRHLVDARPSAVEQREPEVGRKDVPDHPSEGDGDDEARDENGQVAVDYNVQDVHASSGEGAHLDRSMVRAFMGVVLTVDEVDFLDMKGTMNPIKHAIAHKEMNHQIQYVVKVGPARYLLALLFQE